MKRTPALIATMLLVPLAALHAADAMMDFSIRLYEDPETLGLEARRRCEKAKETFRKHVDAGADILMGTWDFGKPYIFSTSNCIFEGMPVESYRVMLDEYRKIVLQRPCPAWRMN